MPDVTARTIRVSAVKDRQGTTNEKDWHMWWLVDGNGQDTPPTFDAKLGPQLKLLEGKEADITISMGKNGKEKLTSAIEHIPEPKRTGGSRYDDPSTQHKITIQACMKIAAQLVVAADAHAPANESLTVAELVRRTKLVASELAVWVDEYAERAANPPFEAYDPDDIPFGAPEGG